MYPKEFLTRESNDHLWRYPRQRVSGIWAHQWVYVLAPVIGIGLGAMTYQAIRE
jgi:glycerol uptake facilitator-like aquaporin